MRRPPSCCCATARVAPDRDAAARGPRRRGGEALRTPSCPTSRASISRWPVPACRALPAGARAMPEVDLATGHLRAPLIGVTGSNGKSTTTVLIARMLEASGLRALVGGNLGTPLCAFAEEPADWVVAELSSFQLERAARLRARIAVLLNLAPDHLDRRGTLEAYGAAKARLAELQDEPRLARGGTRRPWAREVARAARRRGCSASRSARRCARLSGGGALRVAREGRAWLELELGALSRAARTPVENSLAAAAAACAASARRRTGSRRARELRLPHRAQLVHERGGVRFVDDSKATNPRPRRETWPRRPARWCGSRAGATRGSTWRCCASPARAPRPSCSAARPRPRWQRRWADGHSSTSASPTRYAPPPPLPRRARSVLLAPACASFDQFTRYDRGDAVRQPRALWRGRREAAESARRGRSGLMPRARSRSRAAPPSPSSSGRPGDGLPRARGPPRAVATT